MRCKFHPCDRARVGVCSTCLRERLEVVAAELERQRQSAALAAAEVSVAGTSCPEFTLPFPRSVSPYVSVRDRESLFFSTPQLNNSSNRKHFHNADPDTYRSSRKDKRFPFLSAIFGREKSSETPHTVSSSSSSWFSFILPVRQKKSRLFPAGGGRNFGQKKDCGMSLAARGRDDDGSADDCLYGARVKAETAKAAAMPRGRTMQQLSPSGFAFCLSPLMRPSPNHRLQEQHVDFDIPSFSGEVKVFNSGKHPSGGPSSGCNRSRKLCDLGKFP